MFVGMCLSSILDHRGFPNLHDLTTSGFKWITDSSLTVFQRFISAFLFDFVLQAVRVLDSVFHMTNKYIVYSSLIKYKSRTDKDNRCFDLLGVLFLFLVVLLV